MERTMADATAVPSAQALAPYAVPDLRRALLDLATSVVPYVALSAAMYASLDVSYWLTLAIAVPAAGFLLRTFILFHDCTHGRLAYRLFRNPLVMFGVGPIYSLLIQPRLVSRSARPRIRRSVIGTNVAVAAMVGGLCWAMGWREYLLVQAPTVVLGGAAGVFLFYVQHQFEDTYWQRPGDWTA